jgi:dolichol-phosphate mannosyltransferase
VHSLIILPTYNERENLQRLVPILLDLSPDYDLLIVDDASPDGTGDVAEAMARDAAGRVRVMHRSAKLGLASAYIAGFREALAQSYELVFQMDADFQHDPNDLPRFVERARDADVVIGSRYVEGGETSQWSPFRKAISQGGAIYSRALLGLPFRDVTTGFRCYHRGVLQRLDLDRINATGFAFQVELLYRCYQLGARVVELPIVFHPRRVGQSKMSSMIFAEALALVWRLRRETRPYVGADPTAVSAPSR